MTSLLSTASFSDHVHVNSRLKQCMEPTESTTWKAWVFHVGPSGSKTSFRPSLRVCPSLYLALLELIASLNGPNGEFNPRGMTPLKIAYEISNHHDF